MVLMSFEFCDYFISYVNLMYKSAQVFGHTFITSAYADDLCILCFKNEGFEIAKQGLEYYAC